MLEISARVVNKPLQKGAAQNGVEALAQTVAASLVVEVDGTDLAPTRFTVALNASRPSSVDTVKNVPVGKNRRISLWAVDKNGGKTHIDSIEYRFADIEIAAVAKVYAALIPAAGSIYLQLYGLDTDITGVHASFTSLDGKLSFENYVDKSARTFVHIDNIPHETGGVLRVSLIGNKLDTVKTATQTLTFDARRDCTISLQFVDNSGMLGIDAALQAPGVTTGSYNFKTSVSDVEETGELIITEIMYSANDDNYIELYNPNDREASFDTLTTDVDGTTYNFMNVSIAPKGYLVIGRRESSFANLSTGATGGLPIVSTGNWISVKRGKSGPILDRVICGGTNSAVGWPAGLSSSGKRSAELDGNKYNEIDNNFGKNWTSASQPIAGTSMYGTPGR